ncbi:MAG: hypothetical protein CSA20_07430 [Deltaproteobacteria bacterium]|nr:MAG: hypothetical protein CSA20_07430 [Deltaproteobacteria bacterium]
MRNRLIPLVISFVFAALLPVSLACATEKITIIRDIGSKELIGNSLVAIALAVQDNADYLEFPVQMTADGQPVLYRESMLDETTGANEFFSEKRKEDRSISVADLNLNELRQLRQRRLEQNDPLPLQLPIASFSEALALLQRLNASLGKETGCVVDIKGPAFYEGNDTTESPVIDTLIKAGYTAEDKVFIQSNDPDALRRLADYSVKTYGWKFPMIQVLDPANTSWLLTNSGLRILPSYATALAAPETVWQKQTISGRATESLIQTLQSYGIKLLSIGEEKGLKTDIYGEMETSSPKKTDFFAADGFYILDEINSNQTRQKKAPSLPPFFSDLGLKQPENSKEMPLQEKNQPQNKNKLSIHPDLQQDDSTTD